MSAARDSWLDTTHGDAEALERLRPRGEMAVTAGDRGREDRRRATLLERRPRGVHRLESERETTMDSTTLRRRILAEMSKRFDGCTVTVTEPLRNPLGSAGVRWAATMRVTSPLGTAPCEPLVVYGPAPGRAMGQLARLLNVSVADDTAEPPQSSGGGARKRVDTDDECAASFGDPVSRSGR